MASSSQVFQIRPGRWADVSSATQIYTKSFDHDTLLDILFPTRHQQWDDYATQLNRMFETRYWTPGYILTLMVDENEKPVAFSWWRRPVSFWGKWLSPYSWFAAIPRFFVSLKTLLFPLRIDMNKPFAYFRAFARIEAELIDSPRKKSAWYLSTLAVEPSLQGKGLGGRLLMHGAEVPDKKGLPTYLVGLKGTERFYGNYGFKEIARANVGELEDWDGGAIMFRNL